MQSNEAMYLQRGCHCSATYNDEFLPDLQKPGIRDIYSNTGTQHLTVSVRRSSFTFMLERASIVACLPFSKASMVEMPYLIESKKAVVAVFQSGRSSTCLNEGGHLYRSRIAIPNDLNEEEKIQKESDQQGKGCSPKDNHSYLLMHSDNTFKTLA